MIEKLLGKIIIRLIKPYFSGLERDLKEANSGIKDLEERVVDLERVASYNIYNTKQKVNCDACLDIYVDGCNFCRKAAK